MMMALYQAFVATDASLLEINPLIVTEEGELLALDAKMTSTTTRSSAIPTSRSCATSSEEDPLEVEASKFSLNYIKLDGTIGCMVNGAGLAMATMDIIKLAGGEPANFLDVGGGANAEQIKNAFRILMADKAVKAVLINIFGGILRCDVLAEGVIAAVKDLGVPVPIVIRMEGTNVEKGKQMLKESGLNFQTADDMNEAAQQGRRRREINMAVLIDKNTRLLVQGITGKEGTFHAKQAAGVRHHRRRRRDARQGRHDARRLAGVQHRRRVREGDRRQRVGDLRAAPRRRRRDPRGGRRADSPSRCASPRASRRSTC